MNTAIEFLASYTGDKTGYTYSFNFSSNQSTLTIANVGQLEVIDAATWKVKFTPVFGYRGETVVWVYGRHLNGTVKQAQLTLQVGNTMNLLRPALAVRGTGCVTCHAEVHANVITDFGFGGDGQSRDYYFGAGAPADFAWNDGTIYGDQMAFFTHPENGVTDGGAWFTLNLKKASATQGRKVYVPIAALPAGPASKTGATTLKGYVQHRLDHSLYADSKAGTVVEKGTVYIGAPTAARLRAAFSWGGSDSTKKWKYFPDANGAALSGLNTSSTGPTNGKYFTNTGTLVCEGDVLLDGTVYLNNVSVQTKTGCRIYATGSVFMYGPVNYVTGSGDYSKRNLQITSSRAIMMGLGAVWKNSTHCEYGKDDSGYWGMYDQRAYWTQGMSSSQAAAFNDAISDSAKYRLTYFWGFKAAFQRHDTRTGGLIEKDIYNEMATTIGTQYDAACRPEGRDVAYERLLLNAPLVESRYAGTFKGSIVAEMALMSLGLSANQGRFRFEFDDVFKDAAVLPMLKDQDFLNVQ